MRSSQPHLFCLIGFWALMIFSGCSLALPSQDSGAAAFEGPPVIRIASPLPNQTFLAGATVIVQARIENAGPDLARVSVLLDGKTVGEKANPNEDGAAAVPLTIDWPTSNPGQYEIAVTAERGDGTVTRETVTVAVISRAAASSGDENSQPAAAGDEQNADDAASEAVASATPPPTAAARSSAPVSLTAKVVAASNLRAGPSTQFDPPLGSIAANQEVEIVAVNPERDWYKIRYDGDEAWIYVDLVNAVGDTASLPLDAGISLPVNLVVADIAIMPHPLVCKEAGRIDVTVRNEGTADTAFGGWIKVEVILKSTSETLAAVETAFPGLAAGGEYVASVKLAVDLYYNETQTIRVTIDTANHVAESNEDDNVSYGEEYVLQRGGCP